MLSILDIPCNVKALCFTPMQLALRQAQELQLAANELMDKAEPMGLAHS